MVGAVKADRCFTRPKARFLIASRALAAAQFQLLKMDEGEVGLGLTTKGLRCARGGPDPDFGRCDRGHVIVADQQGGPAKINLRPQFRDAKKLGASPTRGLRLLRPAACDEGLQAAQAACQRASVTSGGRVASKPLRVATRAAAIMATACGEAQPRGAARRTVQDRPRRNSRPGRFARRQLAGDESKPWKRRSRGVREGIRKPPYASTAAATAACRQGRSFDPPDTGAHRREGEGPGQTFRVSQPRCARWRGAIVVSTEPTALWITAGSMALSALGFAGFHGVAERPLAPLSGAEQVFLGD